MFSLRSLDGGRVTGAACMHRVYRSPASFQAQRPTVEHTQVPEEPAKGVQV